jgi:hypothetical protein
MVWRPRTNVDMMSSKLQSRRSRFDKGLNPGTFRKVRADFCKLARNAVLSREVRFVSR